MTEVSDVSASTETDRHAPAYFVKEPGRSSSDWLRKSAVTVLYLVVAIGGFLTAVSAMNSRFGDEFNISRVSISMPKWVGFFTILPLLLLIIFVVLAALDAAKHDQWRPFALGPVVVFVVFGFWLLVTLFAAAWAFDGEWLTNDPDSLSSILRAPTWLVYSFSTPAFFYATYSLWTRARRLTRPERKLSWIRHFLAGAIPLTVPTTTALVIYIVDRH